MKGYRERRLIIDLTSRRYAIEQISGSVLRDFIGGRGINSHYLYTSDSYLHDPLSPENVLLIGTGPCNGTGIPGSSRFTVTARSPLTDFLGDSNSGAPFGSEIKYAGYDQIIIHGRSEEPVYLFIEDEIVEIRDAKKVWGQETDITQAVIKKECRDPALSVICIGPGGENLVRFASIMGGFENASGRTGMGAVMGSKNLKAIAVRGGKFVHIAQPERFHEMVEKIKKALASDRRWYDLWTSLGPPGLIDIFNLMGTLPVKNFRGGVADIEGLEGKDLLQNYYLKPHSCFSCPIHCGHHYQIRLPHGEVYSGILRTFAAVADLGLKIGLGDYGRILINQKRVNELGIDAISTGGVISWLMECFEKGVISEKDLDGIEPTWGDSRAILKLIEGIANRKGIGDILAEGSYRAAERLGLATVPYLVTSKKMEITDMDPRGMKAWGLGYATSSRGPCHTRAYPAAEQYRSEVIERWTGFHAMSSLSEDRSKGSLVAWYENLRAISDCLEMCKFLSRSALVDPEMFCEILRCIAGQEYSAEELLKVGERINNVERIYNLRCGLTLKDDTLPDKLTKVPMPEGPCKGETISIEEMLKEYYKTRGWDPKTGIPSEEKRRELGLNL